MAATTQQAKKSTNSKGADTHGRVVRITGPVVDVEFPRGSVPALFNALHAEVTFKELAKTLTLDTKTNKLYLITAEFTPAPPPPPGGRPGRGQMVPDTFSILVVGK